MGTASAKSEEAAGSTDRAALGIVTEHTYLARRPFDPLRFYCLVSMPWPADITASGCFWIATRPEWRAELTCSHGIVRYRDFGVWWAAVWSTDQPTCPAPLLALQHDWHPVLGDRRQEIVITGPGIHAPAIQRTLDQCLVSGDDHVTTWNSEWALLPDPFPRFERADSARVRSRRFGAARHRHAP